jgi:cytochrome c-type biogenesis protein CcmH
LEAEPDNKEGWQQLIRSYMVLGRNADAEMAAKKASEAFETDQAFLDSLKSILAANK